MRRQPLIPILLAVALFIPVGCATKREAEPQIGPIPANGFMKQWGATLDLKTDKDEADRLFLRDDLLLLYTKRNRVYTFAAASGELISVTQVASPGSELRAPSVMGDKVLIPTIATIEVFDRKGRKLESIELERATRSPAAVQDNFIYIGQDYLRGGRLAKMDLSQKYGKTIWELMTFGPVSSQPAIFEDGIYAASEDGRVYAVAPNRDPIWLGDPLVFATEGAVLADLKADEFGVYVASTDSKLYCLDRNSGRIKWTYFAGVPLRSAPFVAANRVYQLIPGRGLAAIDKTEGPSSRPSLWIAPFARQLASVDDKHIYVIGSDKAVVAVDRSSGQPRFRSGRRDLVVSAINNVSSTIYVSTQNGEVLSIQPVLTAGTVGETVLNPVDPAQPLAMLGVANSQSLR